MGILFIDASPAEQRWALKRIYKPSETGLTTADLKKAGEKSELKGKMNSFSVDEKADIWMPWD